MTGLHATIAAIVLIAAAREQQAPPAPAQACVDIHRSPDYVPGVGATGHAVTPADLPADSNLAVNTDIFAQVQTGNKAAPSVGVEIDASALDPKPPCPEPTTSAAQRLRAR
jgi:hypothetical protein